MKIKIPYGDDTLSFEIPKENILLVGEPKGEAGVRNQRAEISNALRHPIGSRSISQLVKPDSKVAVISDDFTRPTPSSQIVLVLLDELNRAGVKDDNVKLVIASGIHRKMTEDELISKFGNETLSRVSVIHHNADDETQLRHIGETTSGTPVWINKAVVEADFRVTIGLIEAHCYAGFGGGPKTIMPGVAGKKTIYFNHGNLARSEKATFGSLDGNPLWLDIVEVAEMVRLDMILNVVLDSKRRVIRAFAGDPIIAHRKGIGVFNEVYGINVPRRADVVIASANPKYQYFDLCLASILISGRIVRDGGTMIIAGQCPEGLGSSDIRRLYTESLARSWPTSEQYLEEIASGKYDYEMADVSAIYKMLRVLERSEMIFVTDGLSEREANSLRLNWTRSIEHALEDAFRKHGNEAKVVILPFGGMCLPFISGINTRV